VGLRFTSKINEDGVLITSVELIEGASEGNKMDAYDFGADLHPTVGQFNYVFGMDVKKAAEKLRELARALEDDTIALQSCRVTTITSIEDFGRTVLRMSFSERRSQMLKEVEEKLDQKKPFIKRLWGARSLWPVAAAKVK
jgi:hypothetical protein